MNSSILICIFNYRHDENAKRWLHLLSPYFETVVLDSGNDHVEEEFIQFPNIYYSGLFNEMKKLSEKKDYEFIGQICSDVEIKDNNAELLIKELNNIYLYNRVGIWQPSVTKDSRKCWSKSSIDIKNCIISTNLIEGWMHFIRKDILDKIEYIDTNKNLYGYGIDIYESIKSIELKYINVIDGFIEVKNPDGTGYNSMDACIQGDKYIKHVTEANHNLEYYTKTYKYEIITKNELKYAFDMNKEKTNITFVCPIRGREEMRPYFEKNIEQLYGDIKHQIIYVQQIDDGPFLINQLRNIGFLNANSQYIVYRDVDNIEFDKVDFESEYKKHNGPFRPFNTRQNIKYNEDGSYIMLTKPFSVPGCGSAVITKDDFLRHNGFSNLYVGWGPEDVDNVKRYSIDMSFEHVLGHIDHPSNDTRGTHDCDLCHSMYYDHVLNGEIDEQLDGYRQMYYEIDHIEEYSDKVKEIFVKNIGVYDDYEYLDLYEQYTNYYVKPRFNCCFIRCYMNGEILSKTKFNSHNDILYINGSNGLFEQKLLEKIFIDDKLQEKYDYIILVDEDCKILDMHSVYDIISDMQINDIDISGMPDGDCLPIRHHRKDCPNMFFTIFKSEKTKKFDLSSYNSFKIPTYIDKPESSNFESYYKMFTYLIYNLGCNFKGLAGKTSSLDDISSELYYNDKIFCVHTWYTREYNTSNSQRDRINKILESYPVKVLPEVFGKLGKTSDEVIKNFYSLNLEKQEYKDLFKTLVDVLIEKGKCKNETLEFLRERTTTRKDSYLEYMGWHSYFTAVKPVKNHKNSDKHSISFIIVNRDGTQIDKVVKNIREIFSDDICEIVVITQEDRDLFKRGQLYNAAVMRSNGKYLCLMDNDIINLRYVNLIETYNKYEKKPFVLFKDITQLTYTSDTEYKETSTMACPDGFGGTLFISKDDFVKKNGYSNLCFGWGSEDTISNMKFGGIMRLDQDLGHITHKRRFNDHPGNTDLNTTCAFKYDDGVIDSLKDGYDQTCFETVYDYIDNDDVRRIGVKNFSVPLNFEYMDFYNKQVEESKKKPKNACVLIPIFNEIPSKADEKSFEKCLTVFKDRKVITICKQGFDLSKYKEIEGKVNSKVIRPNDFFNYFIPAKYFDNENGMQELFKTSGFYDLFKEYDYILRYDLTSYVFSDRLDEFMNMNLDYLAGAVFKIDSDGRNMAHYADEDTLALMKISKMQELSALATSEDYNVPNGEWFCEKKNATTSDLKTGMSFSFNNEPYTCFLTNGNSLPMGCSKFMDNYDNFWKYVIKLDE